MSAPVVVSVNPPNLQSDVVLGAPIVVTFDQAVDTTTVTNATFSITGPGQTQILTPEQLIVSNPSVINSREVVTGTIAFSSNNTVVSFTPDVPLRPNVTYTVFLVGADGALVTASIANPVGAGSEKMAHSYQWSFTTGDLNVTTPPDQSPLLDELPQLNPNSDIKIRINNLGVKPIGNDLSVEVDVIFPSDIDPNSFNMTDLLLSLDPIVNDLFVTVPPDLVTTAEINRNVIRVTITGW
jgi:hypothetical protein